MARSVDSGLTGNDAEQDHVCPREFRGLHDGGISLLATLVEMPVKDVDEVRGRVMYLDDIEARTSQ
jgi:hypothetical protein